MNSLKDRLSNHVATAQARVVGTVAEQKAESGESSLASDLDAINRHALKPMTLDEVFIFEFELSNSNVDAYYTRMTVESLQNYAERINTAGVPLLANHDSYTFPVGRIYWADVTRSDDGVHRLICRAYIVRGDENAEVGISGDSLIRKIETGVQKDTSIGFIPGGYTCSICSKDMVPGFFSRVTNDECDHYPGATYEGQTCYAWVENGIILEGSLVYTGACPEAIIHKAKNAQQLGKLNGSMLHSVCNALHIEPLTNSPMQAKELLTRVANSGKVSDTLKRSLEEKAATLGDEPEEKGAEVIAEAVAAVEAENTRLSEENNALKPKAADGEAYRTTLIGETLAEGVRALGEAFNREEMEKHFRSASLDHIKAMRTQYEALTAKLAGQVNLTESQKTELGKTENGSSRPVLNAAFK